MIDGKQRRELIDALERNVGILIAGLEPEDADPGTPELEIPMPSPEPPGPPDNPPAP